MRDLKSILKNTSYLVLSDQALRGISFIQVIILVRYLGKSGYGIWSLAQSLPAMFLVLTDLGINSIMLRKIAQDKNNVNMYFQKVIWLKLILLLLFIGVIAIFLSISNYSQQTVHIVLFSSLAYSIMALSDVIVAVFRATENFAFEAIINFVKSALFVCIVIIAVYFDMGIYSLIYSFLIVNVVVVAICFLCYSNRFTLKLSFFPIIEYLQLLKEALPFAVFLLVNPIFMQIDLVMLSRMSTLEAVGIYNAAYRIILFLYFIPVALKRTLFPRLSALYGRKEEEKEYKDTLSKICRIVALIGLPASVGLYLLSYKIIVLAFSSEYEAASKVLAILSISIFFYYIRTIFGVVLFSSNNESRALLIFSLATLINLGLDYLLIPKFDYNGAAAASVISEIFIFMGYYFIIRKRIFNMRFFKTGIKIICSCIIMGFAVTYLYAFSLILQILVGVLIYWMSIYWLKVIKKEEVMGLTGMFKFKRKRNAES